MKSISVRELRSVIPQLKQTLAQEHELVLLSNGEPVARILPIQRKRQVPSLSAHRERMNRVAVPSEVLVREERDRR